MEILSIQNIIIFLLIVTLLLSFLGINVIFILASFLKNILNFIVYTFLGYTTEDVLNPTYDLISNARKGCIDSSVQPLSLSLPTFSLTNFFNSLVNSTQAHSKPVPLTQTPITPDLNNSINTQSTRSNQVTDPSPSLSTMPLQNPISSSKTSYCLVGEFQSKRGCVEIGDDDLCMSGQIFSSKELCLNPTLTSNMQPSPTIAPFNSIAMFPLPPIWPDEPNELRPHV